MRESLIRANRSKHRWGWIKRTSRSWCPNWDTMSSHGGSSQIPTVRRDVFANFRKPWRHWSSTNDSSWIIREPTRLEVMLTRHVNCSLLFVLYYSGNIQRHLLRRKKYVLWAASDSKTSTMIVVLSTIFNYCRDPHSILFCSESFFALIVVLLSILT